MSGTMVLNRNYDRESFKWRPMFVLSFLLHGLLFSALFWVPGNGSSGLKMNEVVYEVDLVEGSQVSVPEGTAAVAKPRRAEGSVLPSDNRQAKRIYTPSRKSDRVTVAKRIVKRSSAKSEKVEVSSSQLLDKAISGIEDKSAKDDSDYLEKAIAAVEQKVGSSGGTSTGRRNSSSGGGASLRIYQMQVETWIKSHWAYPDALGNQKKYEAVVLLNVKKDGTVLGTRFIRPSGNSIFDDSVLKAVEKAKPLPPLPEGYEENHEEIEINFNLRDLE